jgi:hypothetical protein
MGRRHIIYVGASQVYGIYLILIEVDACPRESRPSELDHKGQAHVTQANHARFRAAGTNRLEQGGGNGRSNHSNHILQKAVFCPVVGQSQDPRQQGTHDWRLPKNLLQNAQMKAMWRASQAEKGTIAALKETFVCSAVNVAGQPARYAAELGNHLHRHSAQRVPKCNAWNALWRFHVSFDAGDVLARCRGSARCRYGCRSPGPGPSGRY